MNPQTLQQQGRVSGFLGTALTTAAGVAGGMVLGNALMGMFSGGEAQAATAVSDATSGATGGFGEQAISTPTSSSWADSEAGDAAGFEDEAM